MAETVNIASYLPRMALREPDKRALVYPERRDRRGRVSYTHLTFRQLDDETDCLARGFQRIGIRRGVRTLLMVRPSLEFVSIAFALFKTGAVPIFVDPGMGLKAMLTCFREAEPVGFIGVPRAHILRRLFPGSFRFVEAAVAVGGGWLLGGVPLEELAREPGGHFPIAGTTADETAAIFFTSGSTGIPKGVPFTHGMIQGQVTAQQTAYGIGNDEIDMPAFPLFALFSTAFGATAVIPDMDPTRPAKVDPVRIVEAIVNNGVTHSFGSPAIWHRVGNYCDERKLRLPSIRRILMAGAPVPGKLLQRWKRILPNGEVHTPYGATECLGVSSISASEVCSDTWARSREGAGTCVGRPIPGTEVRILRITPGQLMLGPGGWPALEAPPGAVGEITVRGPLAATEYFRRPEQTRLAKIDDGGSVWHRMGDLGYFDAAGRLWFCGRKSHLVVRKGEPVHSVMVEERFNSLEGIHRTALVGVPSPSSGQAAVLIVEPEAGCKRDRDEWGRELLALSRDMRLSLDGVLFHASFPVDVRHNAKIRREDLSQWAAARFTAP